MAGLLMNDLVARLHEGLVEALRRRQQSLAQPVTVAEIYQDLIPYRLVRSEFGFALNADYEHALLQLLAGEGDYVRIEPPEARAELRRELNTPNPNVAMIRHYAACDVFVMGHAPAGPASAAAAKVSEKRREPVPKPAAPAPTPNWEPSLITGKPA
ncbi:MAG TPA: hypothetical protein VK864_06890, partial [Longimicrobiales bacterium]|nr:hypothetical protein [Longimicrobiales bacterium]